MSFTILKISHWFGKKTILAFKDYQNINKNTQIKVLTLATSHTNTYDWLLKTSLASFI
jgi:hypothetical protein